MSWMQNSGMHVAATHTDRYKDAPSRILPRQTSPLKPIHSCSSLPLPWFPYARCSDTHIPYALNPHHQVVIPEPFPEPLRWRTDTAQKNLTTNSETYRMWRSATFLIYAFYLCHHHVRWPRSAMLPSGSRLFCIFDKRLRTLIGKLRYLKSSTDPWGEPWKRGKKNVADVL